MGIKEVIYGARRERIFCDESTIGGIIVPLIKIKQYDVIVYGAGGGHK